MKEKPKNTPDILFEYLKAILYHPEQANLSLDDLPLEFQKFGRGMQLLGKWLEESKVFLKSLAKGDLTKEAPTGDNVIAAPLKELQASLRHLAWQSKQVAKGDYNQKVDFMGEFSTAFNTMTAQLKAHQEAILKEKELVEAKNRELEQNLELVMLLMNITNKMIFVYSIESDELLFLNEAAKKYFEIRLDAMLKIMNEAYEKEKELSKEGVLNWEIEIPALEKAEENSRYFQVESYQMKWNSQDAIVAIMNDETVQKQKEKAMFDLAYRDQLTGLKNRRYAMEVMQSWIEEKSEFLITFIDVDHLKYCNDTFGHSFGDIYLREVAELLATVSSEACRMGGDEFLIFQKGITREVQNEKMEEILKEVIEKGKKRNQNYSFSYASVQVPASSQKTLEDYLEEADYEMYEYKKRTHRNRKR